MQQKSMTEESESLYVIQKRHIEEPTYRIEKTKDLL